MIRGLMAHRLRATLAATGVAALLAGCGGEPSPVRDRDAVLRIKMSEYRFQPQVLSVRSGRVRIIARNGGILPHNVKIEQFDTKEGEQPIRYGGTPTARPGETVADSLQLWPGKYRLVCTIGNHENLGQYATLYVTER